MEVSGDRKEKDVFTLPVVKGGDFELSREIE